MAQILVVDEAPIYRRFVAVLLRNHGHRVFEASDGDEAVRIVRTEKPDLMLVDILMPSVDGCQLVINVRTDPDLPQPRVLLGAAANVEAETRALAHAFGASFVVKPANPDMLLEVVNAALAEASQPGNWNADRDSVSALVRPIVKLIRRVAERNAQLEVARTALDLEIMKRLWAEQELMQSNSHLGDQAMRDVVTGLHNRRYLEESLEREESRARRSSQPLAVMMIDIDRFKDFNDTLGHAAGDAVLRAVGQFMASLSRGEDIVARYGGDEFALVMAQASKAALLERAESICSGVRKLEIGCNGQHVGPVTLSVGIGIFPDHGDSARAVLQAADAALIRSKRSGRNRVEMGESVSA